MGLLSALRRRPRHAHQPVCQDRLPHPAPLGEIPGLHHRGKRARRRDRLFLPQRPRLRHRRHHGLLGARHHEEMAARAVRRHHRAGQLFPDVSRRALPLGRAVLAGGGCDPRLCALSLLCRGERQAGDGLHRRRHPHAALGALHDLSGGAHFSARHRPGQLRRGRQKRLVAHGQRLCHAARPMAGQKVHPF